MEEKSRGMTEPEEITQISLQYWDEGYNSRRPIQRIWDRCWGLFNNNYDFSKKAPWQSRKWIPKFANAVRTGSAFLKKALIRAKDFFVVDAKNPTNEEAKNLSWSVANLIKRWLEINKFVDLFAESITSAMLANLMIFKVYWKQSENTDNTTLAPRSGGADIIQATVTPPLQPGLPPDFAAMNLPMLSESLATQVYENLPKKAKGELRVEIIDPYNFIIDPTGRRKYCIQRSMEDLGDVKEIAEKAGYDIEVITKIEEDFKSIEEENKERVRKGQAPSTSKSNRKQIELMEYWGDIYTNEGTIMYRNVTWTMANRKYLLRKPVPNPFLFKKWPFVWGPVVKKPFSVYHKSLMEDAIGTAEGVTDLINMASDTNAYAGAKAFEVDLDVVYDPEELKDGIYPGKVLKKRSGGQPNTRLINEISLGMVSPQILRLYEVFDREFQNSTTQNEFITGRPATRGRPTATEVVTKTQQSGSIMEDIALDIEDNILAPLLEIIYQVTLQYQTDFDDPRMGVLTEELKKKLIYYTTLPESDKMKFMDLFDFKVRGLSGVIARESEMQKILGVLQIFGSKPELMVWLKIDKIVGKIMESINWDPKEAVRTPEEVQQIQQQQMQMQQQMMEQQEKSALMGKLTGGEGG